MTDRAAAAKGAVPPQALVRALRRVLRPLVRLMLARGVGFPYLAELLKGLFVEVAEAEFALRGKTQTASRLSLLSGVHRKDVQRLRRAAAAPDSQSMPAAVSLGAQLVGAWLATPQFCDRRGKPRALARSASAGGEVSFEALVARVSKDIRARAVLDEWLRLDIVRVDEKDRVCLNEEAFVPARGFDEKAFYFGQNCHDHAAAAVANLLAASPPFLERSVHYDALSPESAAALARLSARAGMAALKSVNRRALRLEGGDAKRPGARQRINFGVYFYTEPMA
jgi:hypothetical protein